MNRKNNGNIDLPQTHHDGSQIISVINIPASMQSRPVRIVLESGQGFVKLKDRFSAASRKKKSPSPLTSQWI